MAVANGGDGLNVKAGSGRRPPGHPAAGHHRRATPAAVDRAERERRWAVRIRAGDPKALELLVRVYYDELFGFARRFVKATDAAEDLVQDIFVRLWRRRADWVPNHVRTYLYGAVRNEALRYHRHAAVVRRWEDGAPCRPSASAPSPQELLERDELASAVELFIERMPERRRLVFVLHRQHGLTYREISDVLGISVSTVETHIRRALDGLRSLLDEPS